MTSNHSWVLIVGLLCLVSCGPVSEPEAAWVPLFNGQDLSGWEIVGGGDWGVQDGCIVVERVSGDTSAGWLVTEKDFSDFKLKLKFKTGYEHFNSGILFRDPGHSKVGRPAFNGYECQLYQGDTDKERNTTGAIYDLARTFPHRIEPNTWVEVELHCSGDRITSFVDGKKMTDIQHRRSRTGAIGLQLHGGKDPARYSWKDIELMVLPKAPEGGLLLDEEMELAKGRTYPLLQSKSLEKDFDTYWDGGATWSLEDGLLRGENPEKISWIFLKEDFADFILDFDYRLSEGGNAGVSIRLPWPKNNDTSTGPAFLGFECQIAETGEINPTGSIYELARAYELDPWHQPTHKPGAWNHYRIYAKGDHLVTYVNRRKTAETYCERSSEGRIGFQVHEPAEWVEYKNVTIKILD